MNFVSQLSARGFEFDSSGPNSMTYVENNHEINVLFTDEFVSAGLFYEGWQLEGANFIGSACHESAIRYIDDLQKHVL